MRNATDQELSAILTAAAGGDLTEYCGVIATDCCILQAAAMADETLYQSSWSDYEHAVNGAQTARLAYDAWTMGIGAPSFTRVLGIVREHLA